MKIGDKVLLRHYVPIHGYIFNVIKIENQNDIDYVYKKSDQVVMVSNADGSFGKKIDKLLGMED